MAERSFYRPSRVVHLAVFLLAAALAGLVQADTGDASAGVESAPPAASQPAAESVAEFGVRTDSPGTYDLRYRDSDLLVVLRQLSAHTRKNIITTREVQGKVSADLYGVTFHEALEAVLKGAGFVYREEPNFIYVYTPKQLEEILRRERQLGARTFKLSYITAADARSLIAPMLSSEGTTAVTPAAGRGIPASDSDAGGDSFATNDLLVVRDYQDNLQAIADVIREIDVKPEQVQIQATILRATLNEENSLGIDFSALAGVNFGSVGAVSPGAPSLTPAAMEIATGGGGLSFGLITNNISFFINALESVSDVTVLANPSLLVVNKQRGQVMIGNRDGYLTTTITETVATQTVQFLETGTQLIVRPFIAKDGYIRMEIHPKDSSGSVRQVHQSVLPSETTTEVTTNVLVRDGHTIVIGGLFRELTRTSRSQVPLVGNIPYVGALFRNTSDQIEREEVVILITPRIVRQEVAEAVAEQMQNDVERYRIGQRRGLQWWGRSRLAQTHMRWARQELRVGNEDKALWNIDMALSLSPRLEEAIDLKERLTERAYWADEARSSSSRYIVERLMMQELGRPLDEITPPNRPLDPMELDEEVREAFGIQPRPLAPMPEPVLPPCQPMGEYDVEVNTPADPADEPQGTQDQPAEEAQQ